MNTKAFWLGAALTLAVLLFWRTFEANLLAAGDGTGRAAGGGFGLGFGPGAGGPGGSGSGLGTGIGTGGSGGSGSGGCCGCGASTTPRVTTYMPAPLSPNKTAPASFGISRFFTPINRIL